MTDISSAAAVEAAYRRYITDYPAALWRQIREGGAIDYAALDFWRFPMLFVTGWEEGTAVSIVDLETFDRQVRGLYAGYHAEGWAGDIRLDRAAVELVTPETAIIETAGTRFRGDGSVLNRWEACYWMRLTAAGWKHFAVVDTEPPRPSPRDWVGWLAGLQE